MSVHAEERIQRLEPRLCECGCGEPTKLADRTSRRYGMVKGQPLRFIHGHNAGRGAAHHAWRGDKPGYWAVHAWVMRIFTRTGVCEHCNQTERPTEWANRDHEYSRERADWMELCRSCHRRHDDARFGRSARPHLRKIRAAA